MPYKNQIKRFAENTYYHLYGRGVNKMTIFQNRHDYSTFRWLFNKYLNPKFRKRKVLYNKVIFIPSNAVYDQVSLAAYCLMKNHFHLLCKNYSPNGITKLMRRVLSNYSNYYNLKHDRQGPLIQGGYRAVIICSEEQLIQTSRYIHLNPVKDKLVKKAIDYKYSSYNNYLKRWSNDWLKLDKLIMNSTDYPVIERYLKDFKKRDDPY